ncbi:hypothetical protein [Nostoc punctiforme]
MTGRLYCQILPLLIGERLR